MKFVPKRHTMNMEEEMNVKVTVNPPLLLNCRCRSMRYRDKSRLREPVRTVPSLLEEGLEIEENSH